MHLGRGYWCQYAVDWIAIKNTWQLTATEPEAGALGGMLGMCTPARTLTVVRVDPPQTFATTSPAPTKATYASCDEAAGRASLVFRAAVDRDVDSPMPRCRTPETAMATA